VLWSAINGLTVIQVQTCDLHFFLKSFELITYTKLPLLLSAMTDKLDTLINAELIKGVNERNAYLLLLVDEAKAVCFISSSNIDFQMPFGLGPRAAARWLDHTTCPQTVIFSDKWKVIPALKEILSRCNNKLTKLILEGKVHSGQVDEIARLPNFWTIARKVEFHDDSITKAVVARFQEIHFTNEANHSRLRLMDYWWANPTDKLETTTFELLIRDFSNFAVPEPLELFARLNFDISDSASKGYQLFELIMQRYLQTCPVNTFSRFLAFLERSPTDCHPSVLQKVTEILGNPYQ
jgi:hypothetical protein